MTKASTSCTLFRPQKSFTSMKLASGMEFFEKFKNALKSSSYTINIQQEICPKGMAANRILTGRSKGQSHSKCPSPFQRGGTKTHKAYNAVGLFFILFQVKYQHKH